MDEKLARYRSKKKRELFIKSSKDKIFSFLNAGILKNEMTEESTKLSIKEQVRFIQNTMDNTLK